MTSSPGCWTGFGRLLAADYMSPERMKFHQVIVDAYAAQHPGDGNLPQQVQSVGLHLMTLCLFLENGTDPSLGTALHQVMVRKPSFRRLGPSGPGTLLWDQVPVDGEPMVARAAAYAWARAVWTSYESEHATVRRWLNQSGFALRDGSAG